MRYVGKIDEQIEDINNVTLDEVKSFHKQFYGASHGEVVIIGQFVQAEALQAAQDLLGNWSSSTPYQRIATTYRKTSPVNLKIETPSFRGNGFRLRSSASGARAAGSALLLSIAAMRCLFACSNSESGNAGSRRISATKCSAGTRFVSVVCTVTPARPTAAVTVIRAFSFTIAS